jgi:hypothetical protein
MAPPVTKKRRRNPYGCADAVTSFLDTLVINEAEASSTAATTGTKRRPFVLTPQAAQAMTICHERFLQILAAELAMGAEGGEDPSAGAAKSTLATGNANAATARTATGLSVVQPAHVMSAIQQLGWEESAPPVVMSSKMLKQAKGKRVLSAPKRAAKERVRKKKREWTTEELAAQERLIAASKQKLKEHAEA